ncbi:hypothetical protein ACLB2K_047928 [Fragaria x ananassa]
MKKGLMEDHGSRNIDVEALENSLKAKLCGDSPLSAKCCIFRVHELLRRHKPEAYQPDIVSIGPFHGSGELFEPMKKVKLCCLGLFSSLYIALYATIKSLTTLVLNFFSTLSSMSDYCEAYTNHTHDEKILHMLDLIKSAIVVPFRKFESTESKYALPHATALLEAGIEFRRSSVDGLMNIDFKDGVLTIPQLAIAEITEPLFRNLIAFEQCYHGRMDQVASYALLMDNLISSSKDVVFLCDKQIIFDWFSAEEVSQFFSKLHTDTCIIKFFYGGLCAEVNKYYEARWNK